MKTAICTHCGEAIEFVGDTWDHVEPTEGYKPFACIKIMIATPRRGSIRKEG